MAARETPMIDWLRQREQLRPFFEGKGGVVRVSVPPGGADTHFNNAVSWQLQLRGATVLQVNGDESTRYLPDVLTLLEQRLELGIPQGSRAENSAILSGISVAGDLNIENVEITAVYASPGSSQQLTDRCQRLIELLKVRKNRLCLMFFRSHLHDPNTLSGFSSQLWDAGLAELTGTCGLLVVDLYAENYRWPHPSWPLPHDCDLMLSSSYDKDARQAAGNDLAELLIARRIEGDLDSAKARARGWLDHVDGPDMLYASLPSLLLRAEDWV